MPEDLYRLHRLSTPQISPDGSQIVFVDRQVGARNDYVSNLWIVAAGEPARQNRAKAIIRRDAKPGSNGHARRDSLFSVGPRALTRGGKDVEPRWSPDGSRIAFVRSEATDLSNLYVMESGGGEPRRLTNFPEGTIAAFLWAPNGKNLAVSFCPWRPDDTREARKLREIDGLSDPPQIVERLWYRMDGESAPVTERRRLYLVDAQSGDFREIYGQDVAGSFTFDFSPDSRQLVLSTNRAAEPFLEPWKDELLRIDLASGRLTRLRRLPAGPKTAVRWSPDGTMLAYAGIRGIVPHHGSENFELFVCDAAGGAARSLTADMDACLQTRGITDVAAEPAFLDLQFSRDGRHIHCALATRGESHIIAIPVHGDKHKYLTRGAVDVSMGNLSLDGRKMALTVSGATRPAEIALLQRQGRDHRLTMLTDLNGPLLAELELNEPRSHWIEAADGRAVQVWSIVPPVKNPRGSASKKLPAVLEIHGGPHAQFGAGFFHEIQVLAAAGYAVFYSNPRGSKGYGREHAAAIDGRWGTDDWTDIQAVIAFMKKHPAVDARRMGVMGGSYGGYMTNWAISHCRDFAAAITDRCLSNLVSFSGTTDAVEPPQFFFPGNFWDQADARWQHSPLCHAGNIRTPTLIIHSEGDLRCGIEQAEQLYSALKLLNVPVRFVRYPRSTSHGMTRNGPPDMRIHRLREVLAWWEKHLRPRPAKKRPARKVRTAAR